MMKLNGKEIASEVYSDLKIRIRALKSQGVTPALVIFQVGDNPSSNSYVGKKLEAGKEQSMQVTVEKLPESISEEELLDRVSQRVKDPNIHAVIVQRPLPPHINDESINHIVPPEKDVDGLNPLTKDRFFPPIAIAVWKVLQYIHQQKNLSKNFQDWLSSQSIAILGKGQTGGKPIADYFKFNHQNPTIIDSKTTAPNEIIKKANIVISAVGKRGVVKGEDLQPGVIFISVGLSRGEDGKLYGDFEEQEIAEIASFYTPTTGGVGPITVASLLENVVLAAERYTT